ncbi:MAG TPA: hypothetical protein VK009_23850 [Chloroflexota bacterium]|nr:hypothetical protein [Chloroflexota bacterium]
MSLLDPKWEQDCRGAITLLGTSSNLPTPQMIDLVDAGMRKIIQVRDGIIAQLRDGGSDPHTQLLRTALDQVNVALSELASVQYPGALERQHIEAARQVIEKLVAQAQPLVREELEPLHQSDGISGTIQGGVADVEVHRVEATSDTLPHSS